MQQCRGERGFRAGSGYHTFILIRLPTLRMTPESGAIAYVVQLMALSARTAPKGKGVDTITIRTVQGAGIRKLAAAMEAYGEKNGIGFFLRDAKNVAACGAVVLIGADGANAAGIDCGACGFASCAGMIRERKKQKKRTTAFSGPNCAIRMADLGIALGSAAKTASIHNADNRVMYSAGVGALELGLMGNGCTVAYGIPLSATGKNIFFDRISDRK